MPGLERVDVDGVDRGVGRGLVGDSIHGTSLSSTRITSASARSGFCSDRGELVARVQRVVAGKFTEGGRLEHRDRQQLGQLDQRGHRLRVAAQVGRDDQRVLAPASAVAISRVTPR
jgi:hypothetical protein